MSLLRAPRWARAALLKLQGVALGRPDGPWLSLSTGQNAVSSGLRA
jgi:hypothetical protein